MDPIPKHRILCIHGNANNAPMMKRFMRVYEEGLPVEFVYHQAKLKASKGDMDGFPKKLLDAYGAENIYSYG
jgi:hypothetical protein